MDAVEGLDVAEARFSYHDSTGEMIRFLAPRPVDKLARVRSISGAELEFLRSVATATPKITMPSAPTMHFWAERDTVLAAGYPDHDAYFADLAAVYREELADLASRGATYVQMDEVPLAMLCDSDLRARMQSEGDDPEYFVQRYIELVNACIDPRPAGLTIGMHLCRGNFKARWLSAGGYELVAQKLFNDTEVDAFFLEYDTDRAGGFEPLAELARDKFVVLGLLSTKTPVLERRGDLLRRIEEASRYVPLERLALSPQCGFASTVGGNPLTETDEVAREVWG